MASQCRTRPFAAWLCIITLLLGRVFAIDLTYCSGTNTADTDSAYWQYQSNGWCSTHCQDNYAFAIVQGFQCWCSNIAPGDTVPLSDCDKTCPGYGSEDCGDPKTNKFGYVLLYMEPSGTLGAAHSQPSKTPSSSSSPTTSSRSSSTSKSKTSSKSTSSTSSSWTKYTTKSVMTISGDIVTQTVIATTIVAAETASNEAIQQSVSPGAIAGGVVGGVGGLALIVAGVLFFFWRHRRQQQMAGYGESEAGNSGVTRNTSVLSKTGLLGSAEKGYLPPVHTASHRSNTGMDIDGFTPISERRHSRPLFYDQRLNPSALMDNDNNSRASIVTMQDNRDYTRTLNVRNPDPESDDELESNVLSK